MTCVTGKPVRQRGRRVVFVASSETSDSPRDSSWRSAKVVRLLALAHHIQSGIEPGVVADRATVARQLGLTRARITELFELTQLAPNVQEAVLGLEAVDGVAPKFGGITASTAGSGGRFGVGSSR
jgi:hypothetical protein